MSRIRHRIPRLPICESRSRTESRSHTWGLLEDKAKWRHRVRYLRCELDQLRVEIEAGRRHPLAASLATALTGLLVSDFDEATVCAVEVAAALDAAGLRLVKEGA